MRLTNRLNDKAYLRGNCPDGEYFQNLIDKLAYYEDIEYNENDGRGKFIKILATNFSRYNVSKEELDKIYNLVMQVKKDVISNELL